MLGSLVHMLLGATGVVGFLLRFIGPVTIAPTITLIGIGFTAAVNTFADKQWGIAMMYADAFLVSFWNRLLGSNPADDGIFPGRVIPVT